MNVFNKVTLESLKKNRTRTVVTIIGIMLGGDDLRVHDPCLQYAKFRAALCDSYRRGLVRSGL